MLNLHHWSWDQLEIPFSDGSILALWNVNLRKNHSPATQLQDENRDLLGSAKWADRKSLKGI